MKKLIIFGTSSTAKSVYKFVKDYNLYEIIGFVVDREYRKINTCCNLPVFDFETLPNNFDKEKDYVFIAVQWNRLNADRRDHFVRLKKQSFKFANIISPNAIIHNVILGENCWICDGVIIESDVIIHDNVFIKTRATIAHLSTIHNHSFIGANSFIMGNATIGEQTYIGVSSSIFNRVKVGKKCLVGAGVLVKRHLPDFSIIKSRNDSFITIRSTEKEIENKLLANKNVR